MRCNWYKVEAFDYVQFLFEKYHDHQMHGIIEFTNFIDENILRKSFSETLNDLPQLVCRMEKNKWIPVSYDVDEIVKVIECDLSKDNIMSAVTKSNDTLRGPQISIKILRGRNNDIICITMNHMICDGMAFKNYLYLLCNMYNNIKSNTALEKRYDARERNLNYLIRNTRKYIKINVDKNSNLSSKRNLMVSLQGDENNPRIYTGHITRDDFVSVKKMAKENKVTINDVFMAAYFIALYKTWGKRAQSIVCAVDLRKYLGKEQINGLCNMTSNLVCSIQNNGEMNTFEQMLKAVNKSMDMQKKSYDCMNQVYLLNLIYNRLPFMISKRIIKKVLKNPPIAFTNLGIIDDKKLYFSGSDIKKCFITGSIKYVPNFQVAVSTFKADVTVSINLKVKSSEEDKINKFIKCFINEIISACSK